MGKHPDHMVMTGCHTQQLATQFGSKIRSHILHPNHQIIFPDHQLTPESNAKHEWKTTLDGEFFAAGVGVGIAGRGSHILILDDLIKNAQDARSDAMRETLRLWYSSDAYTRLEPNGKVVIINTRWSDADLCGWLLDENEQEQVEDWTILSLPAIAEEDEGWRKEGEPLWPQRFGMDELDRIKLTMTDYEWEALYQQRPGNVMGRLFRRDWWKDYVWNPHLVANRTLTYIETQPYQIVQSWDTAFEEGEENDYCVCTTFLHTASGTYILDVFRKRMIFPELCDKAVELALYWRAQVILVEKKASGHSLVQHLKVNPQTRLLPVIGRVPKGDKYIRAQAVSPYVRNGNLWLPVSAPWKKDFLAELSAFPTAAHDDQVDSFSQGVDYIYIDEDTKLRFGIMDAPLSAGSIYGE